ncbi:MAG: antibiotic biosynthesis monooxygenase [Flavobacteriales bacterium]|nr:antibiotic biosynthesis monooxygenase [Flavobacteriales bacterium]
MITRLVKMTFLPEKVETFLQIFNNSKDKIRAFEGVRHLELLRDKSNSNILFTYSIWENESCLENYRNSDLFKTTWAKTKVLFIAPPEAWTLNLEDEV